MVHEISKENPTFLSRQTYSTLEKPDIEYLFGPAPMTFVVEHYYCY